MASKGSEVIKLVVGVISIIMAAGSAKNNGKDVKDAWKNLRKS